MRNSFLFIMLAIIISSCSQKTNHRQQISLNGDWEITKTGTSAEIPSTFESKVPVPGLIDLAKPALDTGRIYEDAVYWYKTNFTIEQDYPELVQLKIGKAKYYSKVYLNGQLVGEHAYNFTPARFNVREFLNPPGEQNNLIISVGSYNNVPDTVIWGHDFEKLTYIPGIYDDVSLVLSGYPFIKNIQTVPIIEEEKVRVVVELDDGDKNSPANFTYEIKELKSGNVVAEGNSAESDFTVEIPDCQLWTPESPFLYELTLLTDADEKTVRFGMRSFSFDTESRRAILNGKPYFMRGTNVCIFRFFEDPDRALLPWDDDWIIKLHQQFKNMHWNSIRYCIGLPPERWYDIADSLGILIQNEYPLWAVVDRTYPEVTAEHLANEYRSWLPEHWNHPCVVIWDAQNECITNITGEAIGMVRDMDLSNRPWENGWSAPQAKSDPIESHPYLFGSYRRSGEPSDKGPLADLLSEFQIPGNDANTRMPPEDKERYPNPIIINEYAWLWLNRDGSTTTLTDRVYDAAFGENLSTEKRIYLYTRHLGMLTEYWRAHRYCAGVLHFCGLGYSRPEEPRGQTSDNFIDIKNLVYEPQFVKYVKPSFAPVGLMVNFWINKVEGGDEKEIEIYAINDLYEDWNGTLNIQIQQNDVTVTNQSEEITIPALEREIIVKQIEFPSEKGDYQLIAEINLDGESVKSIREFSVE